MKYESTILKRLIDTYGVVGNPRYISEIIKEFIVRGKECFPELFTYQADWLAHIDEFGLNPTYTVSYTGQSIYAPNTLERQVKSAILKGQTLVNISKFESNIEKTSTGASQVISSNDVTMLKTSATYTFIYWIESTSGTSVSNITTLDGSDTQMFDRKILQSSGNLESNFILKFSQTSRDFTGHYGLKFSALNGSVKLVKSVILEGDYTNVDIPYFEGMQSVKLPVLKTTGKNLFDGELIDGYYDASFDNKLIGDKTVYRSIKVYLKRGTYTLSFDQPVRLVREIKDGVYSHTNNDYLNYTFTTETDGLYGLSFRKTDHTTFDLVNIQLEANSTATSYEPFKSNILTVNEDVVLRGIKDVRDELDLLTGEVTERIGEIVLDENVMGNNGIVQGTLRRFDIKLDKQISEKIISDKLPVGKWNFNITNNTTYEFIAYYNPTTILVGIESSKLSTQDLNGLRLYLQQNPITLQYQLATESIKTVALTIKDHNGQSVEHLKSFNGGTHVYTSSLDGSLVPSVDISVETDLEETLKMCSLDGNTM